MKKEKLHIHYDKEGDLLEIRIGPPKIGYMENLGNDMFKRIDNKSGKISGFIILNFKKRTENNMIDLDLPFDIEVST